MEDFEKYKKLGEPDKLAKSEIWQTAIGLQQVDGLKPSDYLIKTAKQNIEGEITIYEVQQRLNGYYEAQPVKSKEDRTEEADKVSARITEILSEQTFSFSPAEYLIIHKRLFTGILDDKIAGKIRDYNIRKDEWVLNGETVFYASAGSIAAALDYDFDQEKAFEYKGLSKSEAAEHIAKFISGIWQIHAFGEGNTRATAVFAIKYMRTLGFKADNALFAGHSWYFRNALVRANYNDVKHNVYATMEYLNRFFKNLLLGDKNILKNREMLIDIGKDTQEKYPKKSPEKHPKKNLLKTKDKILALIAETPEISMAEMGTALGLSPDTIRDHMNRLKAKNIIRRVGPDKGGHWEIIDI